MRRKRKGGPKWNGVSKVDNKVDIISIDDNVYTYIHIVSTLRTNIKYSKKRR